MQILTVEDLFEGKRPDLPFIDPHAAFRSAPREAMQRQQRLI